MNPLPIEYKTGLPALVAPTIEQVREMFPPLVPIQLSPSCVKFLEKIEEFTKILSDKFDRTEAERDLVAAFVAKYGTTVTGVAVNPEFAMSTKDEYELFLRIKDHMSASMGIGAALPPELMLSMRGSMISSIIHQLNFPAMCRDLISRYESARFDVNDYLLFVYGRKHKQVMVYGYKMPAYRFLTSRNSVIYDSDLNITDDGGRSSEEIHSRDEEDTPGYLLAKEWAEANRNKEDEE